MAVKNSFDGVSFIEWDEDIKLRKSEALDAYREKYREEIAFYQFHQYLFAKQWFALKTYANEKEIQIIGDIPIYVAFDSAGTWMSAGFLFRNGPALGQSVISVGLPQRNGLRMVDETNRVLLYTV